MKNRISQNTCGRRNYKHSQINKDHFYPYRKHLKAVELENKFDIHLIGPLQAKSKLQGELSGHGHRFAIDGPWLGGFPHFPCTNSEERHTGLPLWILLAVLSYSVSLFKWSLRVISLWRLPWQLWEPTQSANRLRKAASEQEVLHKQPLNPEFQVFRRELSLLGSLFWKKCEILRAELLSTPRPNAPLIIKQSCAKPLWLACNESQGYYQTNHNFKNQQYNACAPGWRRNIIKGQWFIITYFSIQITLKAKTPPVSNLASRGSIAPSENHSQREFCSAPECPETRDLQD